MLKRRLALRLASNPANNYQDSSGIQYVCITAAEYSLQPFLQLDLYSVGEDVLLTVSAKAKADDRLIHTLVKQLLSQSIHLLS